MHINILIYRQIKIYINYQSSAKNLNNVKLVVLTLFSNHLQKYQVSCSYRNCLSNVL